MYIVVVLQKEVKGKMWIFHVINWGIPGIISLIPFGGVGKGYGVAGSW
jgi:hypothetical protein